jgi:hypothetical protein
MRGRSPLGFASRGLAASPSTQAGSEDPEVSRGQHRGNGEWSGGTARIAAEAGAHWGYLSGCGLCFPRFLLGLPATTLLDELLLGFSDGIGHRQTSSSPSQSELLPTIHRSTMCHHSLFFTRSLDGVQSRGADAIHSPLAGKAHWTRRPPL